jgi:hypothetical protein
LQSRLSLRKAGRLNKSQRLNMRSRRSKVAS